MQHVIEIGLQLPSSTELPPLKIGITLALLRDFGKYPSKKHLFIILVKMLDIGVAQSLYNLGDIFTGSSQFEEEKEFIVMKTSM